MTKRTKTKLNEWLKSLAKREGKKSQVKIGDLREIIGLIADDWYGYVEDSAMPNVQDMLYDLGKARAKRKKRA